MQNLDLIAEELFNKIRGRFPSVTIGDEEGNVTNEPKLARYFDFNFMNEGRPVGKVSISLDEKNVAVVYGEDLVANESDLIKNNWYEFLKELRMFAKKRTLTFDTRDITKSNLNSRDYKFLAKNRGGDDTMNESKMYGTSRVSYQDFDGARLMIKHTESIDQAAPGGRAKKVGGLYIESAEGERFKYPYKHLTGARAMARHVAEGGNAYDDFGKHIVGMSEEMAKLRKFKTYMGRSAVMAESLSEYMDVVKDRIVTVKKTLESLQKPSYYKEAFEGFEKPMLEDVPEDVAENWIDQLTIKQFNEELADVFPYIYKLVSEATKAEELTAEDLMSEKKSSPAGGPACWDGYKIGNPKTKKGKDGKRVNNCVPEELELESAFEKSMGQFSEGFDPEEFEGEFDYDAVGDDGEEDAATVTYKANIDDNGRPVVDPKSIEVHASGNNPSSKLGYDVQADTEMQDMKELLQMAQEDADEMWDSRDNKYAHGESILKIKENFSDIAIELEELADEVIEMCNNGQSPVDEITDVLNDLFDDVKQSGTKQEKLAFKALRKASEAAEGDNMKVCANLAQDAIDHLNGMQDEGNAYANAVRQAKKDGKKKGDKIQGPDGDEITLEKEQKTPLGEFILSYYDRETGEFPKGETAVLTMVEKDYGEEFIEPAKAFITRVYEVTEEYREPEASPEFERMRELAGLR